MSKQGIKPNINILCNQIDFTSVPFSDRGSRLLVFLDPLQNSLHVRLAERLTSLEADIEAYLRRPPFINTMCFVDENGEDLEFQTTTWPHLISFDTRAGEFHLVFDDNRTLAVGLPPDTVTGIRFHVAPQFWRVNGVGGEFKTVRNLFYATNGEILENRINPEKGGYEVNLIVRSAIDTTISIKVSDQLSTQVTPRPFSELHTAAEDRWQTWFEQVPPVDERYIMRYAYAWWVMYNNLIRPQGSIAYEAMMPSKVSYVGLWLWDSAMHALAFRHVDAELARNQIRAMLACQLADGMLPDAVYDEGVVAEINHPIKAEVTKPPILAWAALKLHETDPDLDFLEEIYIPLLRWNAWWFSQNDDDVDGLVQYNHPYSSGLDNNPLWDYGMPVESPDLNTYLCVQMGSLAMMAEFLGLDAEAQMWRRRAAAIVKRMIADFWDPELGVFCATHEDRPIPVITPFNLYPLWTGQLPLDIRDRLIQHLTNPEEFWGEYMLPSVARNDSHFDPESMWRGPVWVNINYFFIEALRQIDENKLADELADRTLELIIEQTGIHEYYNAQTGAPPSSAAQAFGWTAAVFIDLAIAASRRPEEQQPE